MINARNTLVGEILQHLLFKKRMTATDLARHTGVPQPTIHRIVTGKCAGPHRSTLEPIAHFFDLSVEQLKGDKPLPENVFTEFFPVQKPTTCEVPILAWEDLCDLDSAKPISLDGVVTSSQLSGKSFAISLPDFSMEPTFSKESLLIIDPEKTARNRSYVLAYIASTQQVMFRQLIQESGHRFLKALNQSTPLEPMRLMEEDDQILGVLIEARHVYFEVEGA